MYQCEKCGSETRAMGYMQVSVPSSYMNNFTKNNIKSKEFRILGVNWETFDFICTNESCRYVTDGYGNYVTNLKKENERLKNSLNETNKVKVLDEEDVNDLKPIFQKLESLGHSEDSNTLKQYLGLDVYGNLPQFVSGDKVFVPCVGLNATVIKQTLSYDGPEFFWGDVELVYDDGVKGVSNSWQIKKINETS